ncbi:MAG: hypothetical protein H0W99_00180 [Acidobacteria bacterium]|nr:hypothetical protein [Acidobacteriota bacterium]
MTETAQFLRPCRFMRHLQLTVIEMSGSTQYTSVTGLPNELRKSLGAWACTAMIKAKETAQTSKVDVFIPNSP